MKNKKENVFEILNEVLEKSFVLSTIKTKDYTAFEHSLKTDSKKINRNFVKKGEIIYLSRISVRDESLKPSKFVIPKEQEETETRATISFDDTEEGEEITLPDLDDPGYIFALIKAKDIKNSVVIIKDFEFFFEERKKTTTLFHLFEEKYFELKERKIKICLLTKDDVNLESETNFKRYEYSNQGMVRDMLKDAIDHGLLNKLNIEKVSKNLSGFVIQEIENLIKSRPENLEKEAVELKRQRIRELNPEIEIIKPTEKLNFKNVMGLEDFKIFMTAIIQKKMGKASLLLGLPGTGKSYCAKCLGSELGLDTIVLNFGTMMSKYVGESESNTKRILQAVDDYGPAVVFIDEMDKGLAGVGGQGGDSGTSQRQGGQVLTWLNDREMGNGYVLATANNISHLPPEFTRAGRWDQVWYVDRPNKKAIKSMIKHFANQYDVILKENEEEIDAVVEKMYNQKIVGSEVESCLKNMRVLGLNLNDANRFVSKMGLELDPAIKKKYKKA